MSYSNDSMNKELPLTHLRALDLTDEAGAFATRLFADMGGDVIRVEPPSGGRLRSRAPFLQDQESIETSLTHLYLNINKRSIVLDPNLASDVEIFEQLVRQSDFLFDSTTGGTPSPISAWKELVDFKNLNDQLIEVEIKPFDDQAYWENWRGGDLITSALSGLLYVSGSYNGPPALAPGEQSHVMAGLNAMTGALVALADRNKSLKSTGPAVSVSAQEALTMSVLQTSNINFWEIDKRIPVRPGIAPPIYKCSDGRWVALRIRPDGLEDSVKWLSDSGLVTKEETDHILSMERVRTDLNRDPYVRARFEKFALTKTSEQLLEEAWELDLIAMPVNSLEDVAREEHFIASNQFSGLKMPDGREIEVPKSPLNDLNRPMSLRPAPKMNEHRDEILTELAANDFREEKFIASYIGNSSNSGKPLDGLRVLDFCWVLAGPLGGRILSNFGAEVIRVESIKRLDAFRVRPSPTDTDSLNLGYWFNDVNTGKRSVSLDLSTDKGREIAFELTQHSDVVINNYRPHVLDRLGLGFEAVSKINPKIIYAHLPGCGRDGPWADKPTMGGHLTAAAGFNKLMGRPEDPPHGIGCAYPDFTSPQILASSVLAALEQRHRTGVGHEVWLNQMGSALSFIGVPWLAFRDKEMVPTSTLNRSPNACPHNVFPAKGEDSWVAIACESSAQWDALSRIVPQLSSNLNSPDFHFNELKRREAEIELILGQWTSQHESWELSEILQEAGIPSAPVVNLRECAELSPLKNHYRVVQQPDAPNRPLLVDAEPIRLNSQSTQITRAPMFGEHTHDIFREILEFSDQEIAELVSHGIVG
ncbi:MAG: CoA transferase [Chloroflexota bacterium]|nr:CoA transferase [Chloroflexota bacterium]